MFSINKALGILPNASEHGFLVDHMLEFCHWFMAILFFGWSIFFFYTIWRYHQSRNPKANYHGVQNKVSAHLEFSVVLIEAVLLLGFALPLWGKRVNGEEFPADSDAVRVHAIGEQFWWNFHYPGPDGIFGGQSTFLISGNNPIGLDPTDPNGKDDIVTKNELHLINQKPTVIVVSSKDVIHSFALQHMRMTQDAIPGSRIPMWFRPIRIGEYEIVCAQLCGAGHFAMRAILKVDAPADFDAWMKEQTDLQHPPGANAAPAPAPNAPPAAPANPAGAKTLPANPAPTVNAPSPGRLGTDPATAPARPGGGNSPASGSPQ